MDLADDVAYSVHDVEDGVVAGRIDLTRLDPAAVWETVRDWYLPDATDDALDAVLADLRRSESWPTAPYDAEPAQPGRPQEPHQRPDRPLLRRRPAGDVRARAAGRSCATAPTWWCRSATRLEIAVLKGIAAHYVMRADDRVAAMERQRELLAELVAALVDAGSRRPGPAVRRRLAGGAATTRRGCGSSSTRSPRSPTPARWPGMPHWRVGPSGLVGSGQVALGVGVVLQGRAVGVELRPRSRCCSTASTCRRRCWPRRRSCP